MEQEVAHSRGGCNWRVALKVPGEMTSMVHIDIEDTSSVLRIRMLSGALGRIESLSGAPEWMDP
jgi:hypothetical protein